MSHENVELHYRAIDAFNRRDLGAYLTLNDAEVEFTPYEVWVQGGRALPGPRRRSQLVGRVFRGLPRSQGRGLRDTRLRRQDDRARVPSRAGRGERRVD
jgi:hypothetical protein